MYASSCTALDFYFCIIAGLKVAVIKANRYIYLSFSPSFHFDESIVLSSEERKQFTDLFHKKVNGQKPNLYVEKYIKDIN